MECGGHKVSRLLHCGETDEDSELCGEGYHGDSGCADGGEADLGCHLCFRQCRQTLCTFNKGKLCKLTMKKGTVHTMLVCLTLQMVEFSLTK